MKVPWHVQMGDDGLTHRVIRYNSSGASLQTDLASCRYRTNRQRVRLVSADRVGPLPTCLDCLVMALEVTR